MLWITPAPAGKTSTHYRQQKAFEDHPRTCGENYISKANLEFPLGSPPHLRGKPPPSNLTPYFFRITPAPAGKTKQIEKLKNSSEDHPRTCGENDKGVCLHKCLRGSPPHLRGKPKSKITIIISVGITPAPAGKTHAPVYVLDSMRDHPRTCGENSMRSRAKSTPPGSPPHLRGKPLLSLLFSSILRITPAPAGKTKQWILHRLKHRDHPRTCGENLHGEIVEIVAQGSPPHLRGKPCNADLVANILGITPAPAGKTFLFLLICNQ